MSDDSTGARPRDADLAVMAPTSEPKTADWANAHRRAPRELAIPGSHDLILPAFQRHVPPGSTVLDLGAGEGAFSYKLTAAGFNVSACDMFPEMFRCPGIECRKVDAHQPLPFGDGSFEAVVAIEVVEHLESHLSLFREIQRLLKPGGVFLFTTPNIMSLKSRMRFLLTGYFYSHGPLDPALHDPISQHVSAFTPDRYRFMLARAGLHLSALETDRFQSTSRWLRWLSPAVRLCSRLKFGGAEGVALQNSPAALYGRTMIGVARKVGKRLAS